MAPTLDDLLNLSPDQITPQHVHMLGLAPDPVVPPAAPAAPPIKPMTPPAAASATEPALPKMTPLDTSGVTLHYHEAPEAKPKEPKADKVEDPTGFRAGTTPRPEEATSKAELPNKLTPPALPAAPTAAPLSLQPGAAPAPAALPPLKPPVVPEAMRTTTPAAQPPPTLTPPAPPPPIDQSLLNAPKRSLESFASREAEPKNLSLDTTAGGPQILDRPGTAAEQQDILARARDEAANPYGTGQNHPGFLGKLAHGASRIGNILGDIFVPGAMQRIPGTDLNKEVKEKQAEQRLGAAQTRESEAGLRTAQAEHLQAETDNLGKKGIKVEKDANGDVTGWWDKDGNPHGLNDPDTPQGLKDIAAATKGKAKTLTPDETFLAARSRIVQGIGTPEDEATVKAYSDLAQAKQEAKPGDAPLGDKVPQLNRILARRYQVLHPGVALPADYTLPEGTTQKDYDRIDKGLEAEEKARGTKDQQEETNAFKRMALSIAQQNRADKTDLSTKEKILTYYAPAQDADVRLQLMEQNMKDALDHNDQQAMVNLVTNHVAMTLGMPRGKVPRVSHEMFQSAEESAPLLQRATAHFDKDGYLTGIVLSPQQMKQMVDLGKETRRAEWAEANAKADYLGVEKRPITSYKGEGAGEVGGGSLANPEVGATRTSKKTGATDRWDGKAWQPVKPAAQQ